LIESTPDKLLFVYESAFDLWSQADICCLTQNGKQLVISAAESNKSRFLKSGHFYVHLDGTEMEECTSLTFIILFQNMVEEIDFIIEQCFLENIKTKGV
jgi:hypothetical protein